MFINNVIPYMWLKQNIKELFSANYRQKVNEYDQGIPQSHTADQPKAP